MVEVYLITKITKWFNLSMNEQDKGANGMPLPENYDKPSTRHLVVDARFAALLSEDFGIPTATVLDATVGEPKKAAIAICGWASRTDDPAFALVAWSKKHNKGRCRADRRGHREGSARDAGEDTREQHDERRRGTAPARRRGVSGGFDPAKVRANVARMSG